RLSQLHFSIHPALVCERIFRYRDQARGGAPQRTNSVCKLPSKRTLLYGVVVLACQRNADRHPTSTVPDRTVTRHPAVLASSVEARETGAPLHQQPSTLATDATLGAVSSNVVISSVPACARDA